jgi:hypothetical protein
MGSQELDADADPPGPHRGQTFFLIMGRDNSASGETLARMGRSENRKIKGAFVDKMIRLKHEIEMCGS